MGQDWYMDNSLAKKKLGWGKKGLIPGSHGKERCMDFGAVLLNRFPVSGRHPIKKLLEGVLMRFTALLFILYHILKRAAKRNKAFKGYIGSIHMVKIMIKTADDKRGRLFIFDRGSVSSLSGAKHPYDAAIIWSDAGTAFKVMSSMSDESQFKAAAQGKMKLDGMAYFAQWFNDGVKLVM
jgi:hypothetical protein